MKAIQIISQDLFDKVRSRFQNLEMGNEEGGVTIDPAEARFFDFDFVVENKTLGRISISLNDPGSLKLYYSQGITEGQDDPIKKMWYSFLKEMRLFSMRRLLRFDTRDIAKNNLDKNDFQYLAKKPSKDDKNMNTMNESRWNHRSSKKTSRAVKGTTEVIVRHFNPVDEMYPGSRSRRKNIKAIFIQNRDGERFKYPFIHPAGAFAMAQHVDHGGIPHDPAGKAIIKMSEQIAQLQEFQRQVQHASLHDDAMGIKERAIGRLQELKGRMEALSKRHHYESWIAEFNENEHDDMVTELDPVTFEGYKSKFTQTNFNEELGKLFPLIHSIMQEKIDLEKYVGEETTENKSQEQQGNDQFLEFVEWAEAVEQGKLDIKSIEDKLNGGSLKDALSKISLGPDGTVAWEELSNLFDLDERDTDDESLKDQLLAKSKTADQNETGLDSPAIDVFKSWIEDTFPEWKEDLPDLFGGEETTGQEPEAEPTAEPTAEPQPEPAAEPAAPETPEQPVVEGTGSIMKEIAETVKSFYNASNEDVGPFRSEEAVCLEVEKTISEKYGNSAGTRAGLIAKKFMEKLTKQWEMKHHKHKEELAPVENDGLSRLKELLGNVKAKVETINKDKTDKFDKTLPKPDPREKLSPTLPKPDKEKNFDEVQQRNFNPHNDLAGRGRISSFNKTDAGKKADFNRGTERLKDKMKFTKSQGGIGGPKGPLPEMADILKLAGLKK